MPDQEKFCDAHRRWDEASKRHVAMIRSMIDGTGDHTLEEANALAIEVQRLYAEFMNAGEPFIRWKTK